MEGGKETKHKTKSTTENQANKQKTQETKKNRCLTYSQKHNSNRLRSWPGGCQRIPVDGSFLKTSLAMLTPSSCTALLDIAMTMVIAKIKPRT